MPYILTLRFILWFIGGAAITYYILHRKGRDPMVGAILCGVLAGFGGIFVMLWIWLWMWYMMPPGAGTVYKVYNSRRKWWQRF
jgi:hypothetical protein